MSGCLRGLGWSAWSVWGFRTKSFGLCGVRGPFRIPQVVCSLFEMQAGLRV